MTHDSIIDLKATWPWGRQAPLKRLDDLRRRQAEANAKRKRLEEIFKERLIDVDRVLESIEQDMEIALKCEEDRCRRTVKSLLDVIAKRGLQPPKDIEKRKHDQALVDELTLKIKGAPALEPVVDLDGSDDASPGGSVGFDEIAGLARERKTQRS